MNSKYGQSKSERAEKKNNIEKEKRLSHNLNNLDESDRLIDFKIFSKDRISSYLIWFSIIIGAVFVYNIAELIIFALMRAIPNQNGTAPSDGIPPSNGPGNPPGDMSGPPPGGMSGGMNGGMTGGPAGLGSIWPLWGSFTQITPEGLTLFSILLTGALLILITSISTMKKSRSIEKFNQKTRNNDHMDSGKLLMNLNQKMNKKLNEKLNKNLNKKLNEKMNKNLNKNLNKYLNKNLNEKMNKKRNIQRYLRLIGVIGAGFITIFLSNLINGWYNGIYMPIGGNTEIYSDVINILNPFEFIAQYNSIQETLSVHAQTQPPGAVLWIYLFSLISNDPSKISIMIAFVTILTSSLFLYGILKRIFSQNHEEYVIGIAHPPIEKQPVSSLPLWGVILFVVMPAIQVYYLANIYAIVASLILGAIYFYFHKNTLVRIIGTSIFMIMGLFTSFLFVWLIIFLSLYEILGFLDDHFTDIYPKKNDAKSSGFFKSKFEYIENIYDNRKKLLEWNVIRDFIMRFKVIIFSLVSAISFGLILYYILGFNYIESFLYASALENPNGFMLFSDPITYFITRAQDILDIVVFAGPFISVFAWEGFQMLQQNKKYQSSNPTYDYSINKDSIRVLNFIIAGFLGLLILFITGAPKKGETARICMFIIPFLIIPVLYNFQKNYKDKIAEVYSQYKKDDNLPAGVETEICTIRQEFKYSLSILVFLLFAQALLMQLLFNFIW